VTPSKNPLKGPSGGLWAVIPVKALSESKQRLKDFLGAGREAFTLAMLHDVLTAVEQSRFVSRIAVVTADPRIRGMLEKRGITVIREGLPAEMNAAIEVAIAEIYCNGGRRVVVLPGDIPLLTSSELDRLAGLWIARDERTQGKVVGLSPSADGEGTNCLFACSDKAFKVMYGPDSYSAHRDVARSHGNELLTLDSATLSLDIDEPRDIAALIAYCDEHEQFKETASWKFLHRMSTAMPGKPDTEGVAHE